MTDRNIKDINFESIFNTAGVAIALVDKSGNIIISNHQFDGLFLSKTEIKNIIEIQEDGYREPFLRAIDLAYEGYAGVPYPFAFWTSVAGVRRKYEITISRQGGTDFFIMTASDITRRAEAYDELNRRNRELTCLLKIHQLTSSSFNIEDINRATIIESCKIFDFPAGFILLPDSKDKLKITAYYSIKELDRNQISKIEEALNSGRIIAWTKEKFKTILINERAKMEIAEDERSLFDIPDVASLVSVPIVLKGGISGYILFGRRESDYLYFDQVSVLETLAHQIGISIQNALLFNKSEQLKENAIKQNKGLNLLYKIGRQSLEISDIDELFLSIYEDFFSITGFDGIFIMFKSESGLSIKHYGRQGKSNCHDGASDDLFYRYIIESLGRDNYKFVRDISSDESLNPELVKHLSFSGVKSIFITKAKRQNSYSGIFCFFSTQKYLEPTEDLTSLWTSLYVLLESIYKNYEYRKTLEERERELSRYSQRLMSVQDEEKKKIAREIHDSLGQLTYALKLNIFMLSEEKKLTADPVMLKIQDIICRMQDDIRRISYDLSPPTLEEMGLVASLRWLVEHMRSDNLKLDLGVNLQGDLKLPYSTQVQIFRIAQEAITNVLKHAGASEANIFLYENEDGFFMEIVDNGKGFSLQEKGTSGIGLTAMKERAVSIGGILRVESNTDVGTTVLLELRK